MRPNANSHLCKEQPCAGHSPEGHIYAKVLRNTTNYSIALTGMLLDDIALKKGHNPRGSATTSIATAGAKQAF